MCITISLQPFVSSVYPGLLILKVLCQSASNGPAGSPLVADYIKKDSRGIATA